MVSLREFFKSVGKDSSEVSVLEVARDCQVNRPVSLRRLIEGGCKQTISVTLQRQTVFEGNVPYVGRLGISGTIEKISFPISSSPIFVRLVKAGRTTDECNDSDAVIQINAGDEIGQEKVAEILGTSPPRSPVSFAACVGTSPSNPSTVITQVSIDVTLILD